MKRMDSTSVKGPSAEEEQIAWLVPKHYSLPRKVVRNALEHLDSQDSPERPGMVFESTMTSMVERFDEMFIGKDPSRRSQRIQQAAAVVEHLHRHTRRRRGESVLAEGYVEWEQTSRVYELFYVDLNIFERIFFTIDVSESTSILSKICSLFLVTMIILSIVVWMVSTLPRFQVAPAGCVGVDVGDCEPEPEKVFKYIEMVCVYVFTFEYFIRLFTVHSVRFQLLNEHFIQVLLIGNFIPFASTKSAVKRAAAATNAVITGKHDGGMHLDGRLMTTVKHIFNIANIIDLLAILPFWIERIKADKGSNGSALMVLRILRLTRIFRVFKLGKYNDVFLLFSRVIHQSMPALSLMVFFIMLGCVLFGTLIWFAEAGTWYPAGHEELINIWVDDRGAYLRASSMVQGAPLEESPFLSIIHSFWYVIVTITTVGYGDAYPTTTAGKIVGALTILNGIIVLAMPIGVVGANFSSEYYRVLDEKRKRQRLKHQMDTLAAVENEQDAALDLEEAEETTEEAENAIAKIAVELHKVDMVRQRILAEAETIDTRWQQTMPPLLYAELTKSLRQFLSGFLLGIAGDGTQAEGKPVVSISKFAELDALTSRVHACLTSMTSVEDLAEFGLREAHDARHHWATFTDRCWEYAVDMCRVERPQEPPEFYQMKAYLVRSPGKRPSEGLKEADSPGVRLAKCSRDPNRTYSSDPPKQFGNGSTVAEIKDLTPFQQRLSRSGKVQADTEPRLPGMPEDAHVQENDGLRVLAGGVDHSGVVVT